jgi:hypothetical protein
MDNSRSAESERWRRGLGGGIVAGIIAGAVLSVFMTIMNLTQGKDVWVGMKGAALPFLGERAHAPGFDAGAVVLGVLCHFAVSIGWGGLFGVIAYGLSKGMTVLAGALWGIVVWLGMYYAVLPLVGAGEVTRSTPVVQAITTHVLFGLVVGLGFLPYQRTVVRTSDFPTHHAPLPH